MQVYADDGSIKSKFKCGAVSDIVVDFHGQFIIVDHDVQPGVRVHSNARDGELITKFCDAPKFWWPARACIDKQNRIVVALAERLLFFGFE